MTPGSKYCTTPQVRWFRKWMGMEILDLRYVFSKNGVGNQVHWTSLIILHDRCINQTLTVQFIDPVNNLCKTKTRRLVDPSITLSIQVCIGGLVIDSIHHTSTFPVRVLTRIMKDLSYTIWCHQQICIWYLLYKCCAHVLYKDTVRVAMFSQQMTMGSQAFWFPLSLCETWVLWFPTVGAARWNFNTTLGTWPLPRLWNPDDSAAESSWCLWPTMVCVHRS